jgi:hypothetical protein
MTYSLGAFESEKGKIFLSVVWVGIIVCLLIGLPLMLLLRSYEYYLPIWLWIIFSIVVFSITTFLCYKTKFNRLKKEK